MSAFTDRHGKRWDVSITIDAVKRVRSMADVDLLSVLDRPETLQRLAADPITLVDVIYLIVKPQCDAEGVSDEDFGASISGEQIESATEAFMQAVVDFFPGARREALNRGLERAKAETAKRETDLRRAVSDGRVDAAIDAAFRGPATLGPNTAEMSTAETSTAGKN